MQHTIKAGVIQAGEVAPGGDWSLFACTMSPGFIASCFRGVPMQELRGKYAGYEEIIERMGVPDGHETDLPADYVNERFNKG
jgi:predicted cupin superfamily sugar epimerase